MIAYRTMTPRIVLTTMGNDSMIFLCSVRAHTPHTLYGIFFFTVILYAPRFFLESKIFSYFNYFSVIWLQLKIILLIFIVRVVSINSIADGFILLKNYAAL